MIDLAVIGGGPAGLCTAIAAARSGLSVRVYDPRSHPIDKACGEGLMPAGVQAIRALGVEIDGHPFVGVRYVDGDVRAEGTFATGPGLGVRRVVLSLALHRAAVSAGVEFVPRAVREISQDADAVQFSEGPARYVAVADGLHSPLRRSLGLHQRSAWPPRLGLRRHYRVTPWTDRVEVHWSATCEAYVTPISATEVGVALLLRAADLPPGPDRFQVLLADFPELAARLTTPTTAVRGAGSFAQLTRARTRGRAMLIGDAAGYLDPLTGEGLRLAAECAAPLVHAVISDDPSHYESAYKRITAPYFRWTGLLLRIAGHPLSRRQIVPMSARFPGIMDRAIRVLGD